MHVIGENIVANKLRGRFTNRPYQHTNGEILSLFPVMKVHTRNLVLGTRHFFKESMT
jgi:hypothetical protein